MLHTSQTIENIYFWISKKFPSFGKFLLSSQLIDSSRSVTANIAEGYGRYTFMETRRFFFIARGSLTETLEHLTTAFDENYVTKDELKIGEEKCNIAMRLINGYIKYLEKLNDQTKQKNAPNP